MTAHVHGCYLDPNHRGPCLSGTPHQFGPDGCPYCRRSDQKVPSAARYAQRTSK